MIYTFTSSAPNYYPKVKQLRDSVKRFSPQVKFFWLMAEERDPKLVERFSSEFDGLIFADDLEIGRDRRWLFAHNLVELSTALKPSAAQLLLSKQDAESVVYYDPDMVLFSNVDDIYSQFSSNEVLLTPHLLHPEKTLDAVLDNELCSLRHGVFNLGFFGVRKSEEGARFLDWWNERLRLFCSADLQAGLFTDQKWINFAPVFFDGVKILKNSRFNVATWNLSQRRVTGNMQDGVFVDGQPLGFYHFTGFDSGAHEAMAGKYAADNRAIQEMIRWYKESTSLPAEKLVVSPWKLGFYTNKEKIDGRHRKAYRDDLGLQQQFPDPYEASGTNSYLAWCKNQSL